MTISLSSPNSSTASIQKNGGDVITFDANNNATFAGNVVTTGTVVSGSAMGMRNRIINGDMRIWQRGTSFSGTVYAADRWQCVYGTSPTIAQTSDVPTGYQYALNFSGSGFTTISQKIESLNCYGLSGQTVTISFWAKQPSGSNALGIALYYPTAVDNYTSTTIIASTTVTPTSTWAQYTYTVSSLPANVLNGLQLAFNGANASSNFYITGVQLETGSVATPFERRLYGQELALCQRYYENSYDTGTAVATNIGNDSQSRHTIAVVSNSKAWSIGTPYKVKKRTNPSVTLYNRAGTSGQWFWGAYGVNEASSSTIIAASCQNELQAIYTSSYPAGTNGGYGHFSADAEL
jgi:hypothetical protein